MARPFRPNLSLPVVVEAAARVLEREGHAGLTMRAVGAELGVKAPALYWYLKDKQALEIALYDHLIADLVFAPVGDDWREDLRRLARALRRKLTQHRDICRLVPYGFFFAPNSMGRLDTAIGVLIGAGLDPRDAAHGFITCFTYVVNWSRSEGELRARPPGVRPGLDVDAKAVIQTAYPNVAAAFARFNEPADLDEQFAFGLDLLVAGLERLARPPAKAPG